LNGREVGAIVKLFYILNLPLTVVDVGITNVKGVSAPEKVKEEIKEIIE
jgi:hypothetical protein